MGKPPPDLYGIPINEIVRICRVSPKTAARWKDGTTCPPHSVIILLRIIYHGDLAELGPQWSGWRYRGGELTSPDGWRINRNDALAVPLLHGQIDALRQKVSDLENAEYDGLEEQPAPDGFAERFLAG